MYSLNQALSKTLVVCCSVTLYFTGIQAVCASPEPRAYYVSHSGNDKNTGRKNTPFKTLQKINSISLHPGDSVLLKGGQTFEGTLQMHADDSGLPKRSIVISSTGKNAATINGGDLSGLVIDSAKYIRISHLSIKGSGRKNGNIYNGVLLNRCSHISIADLTINGFQKAGLLVYSSTHIDIRHVHAFENGYAGISVDSEYGKNDTRQIYIADCLAENNPGDPSNFNNHSGNGIVVGNSRHVTIDYCVATNNGWDMPRIGNGPVGIWCYEADNIKIRYCISYANKTAKGADDGGGFDFDGGVTNSIIEHCLSYNNYGSAFGIFQYKGAGPWHDNVIRNNISENDGEVSAAHAGVYIWNSTGDATQFKNFSFCNNIVYNKMGSVIHYADGQDERNAFNFYNNIFVAKDDMVSGKMGGDIFNGNTWWSLAGGFNSDSIKDFKTWVAKTGKEQKNGKITGKNVNPHLTGAGNTTLKDPHKLTAFIAAYRKMKK
ncbi:MAG: right-handed parallel beta-helix repeat-containing protein [Mucilaginibacter sp.]